MREGIGSIFLYNIIILFIVVIFAFLAGAMSYSKAFRVNSRIINALEKYEGYNELSDAEIERVLTTLGYRISRGSSCPKRDGVTAVQKISDNHEYCLYYHNVDSTHYNYGVLTYIYMDLPVVGDLLKIPVYTTTSRIYHFNG